MFYYLQYLRKTTVYRHIEKKVKNVKTKITESIITVHPK
jgi:hypothetical protein